MNQQHGHRLLPHTADMGIEAWAEDLPGVFVEAAHGLVNLLFGTIEVKAETSCPVHLDADNEAELLVAWLNEILYHLETADLVPAAFRVAAQRAKALDAEILGESFDPQRHPVQRQAKAVTYHRLALERRGSTWYARVYVDL